MNSVSGVSSFFLERTAVSLNEKFGYFLQIFSAEATIIDNFLMVLSFDLKCYYL